MKYLNLDYRVKAGALQFTMFVVVALILAAFIILLHTYKTFRVQTNFVIESINNADKGIHYTLQNKLQLKDTIQVNLKDEDYKSIKVHRDYWGVFEKVTTISTIKHKTFKKLGLVGGIQSSTNRTALYLEDKNRPLVLVGHTKIQGNTYLPKQGVRTGNIAGHSYYGESLVYGTSKTSESELPKLMKETTNYLENIQNNINLISEDQFFNLDKQSVYKNSFYNPLQVIYSNSDINLYDVDLTGHILIQSKSKIIVDPTSNLKDVVLVAPEILVKSYSKGVFQALATRLITVENNCTLQYPSALVLNEKTNNIKVLDDNVKTPLIKVSTGSKVKGIIAYFGNTTNYRAQVFIDKDATVTGEVYCNKNLELLGAVYGSVYTSSFVANQSGSSYQNHIYNGTIIANNLAEEYVGLSFKNSNKNIAKWLY